MKRQANTSTFAALVGLLLVGWAGTNVVAQQA
jgi:hypothetical protein